MTEQLLTTVRQAMLSGKRPDWATVELEDESQPDGAVVVRDSWGNVVAVMSRETFEGLRGGR